MSTTSSTEGKKRSRRSDADYTEHYYLFIDSNMRSAPNARKKVYQGKKWVRVHYPDNKMPRFVMDLVEGYWRVHENLPKQVSWGQYNSALADWISWFCEDKGKSVEHIMH